jgi:hypothetical protein
MSTQTFLDICHQPPIAKNTRIAKMEPVDDSTMDSFLKMLPVYDSNEIITDHFGQHVWRNDLKNWLRNEYENGVKLKFSDDVFEFYLHICNNGLRRKQYKQLAIEKNWHSLELKNTLKTVQERFKQIGLFTDYENEFEGRKGLTYMRYYVSPPGKVLMKQ